jgi:hypothetical protein
MSIVVSVMVNRHEREAAKDDLDKLAGQQDIARPARINIVPIRADKTRRRVGWP